MDRISNHLDDIFTLIFALLLIILLIAAIALLILAGYIMYKKYMNTKPITPFDPEDTSDCQTLDSQTLSSPLGTSVIANASDVSGTTAFAVATETNKKGTNQDSFCQKYLPSASASIIAVADGVGSSFRSEIGSAFVANRAVELIAEAIEKDPKQIDFDCIFNRVQQDFDLEIEKQFADQMDVIPTTGMAFATTLVVGIDLPDRFIAAYVGNGSIIHLSNRFITFPKYICVPWNAVNLLNPHTVDQDGKESLYRVFFYKGIGRAHQPSVVEVRKQKQGNDGEIFIITTDGVNSNDHDIAGKDEEGSIWSPVSQQLADLYDHLKAYVTSPEEINNETLLTSVETYLKAMKEGKKLDDDTTLGVFITPLAIKYFKDIK